MKLFEMKMETEDAGAAAFGRLCVETGGGVALNMIFGAQPPSGGCVLKRASALWACRSGGAAAFGRLCVETGQAVGNGFVHLGSRLRAAVC